MKKITQAIFLLLFSVRIFAQTEVEQLAGKVFVNYIDISPSKSIRLPEGRWMVMGEHNRELSISGVNKKEVVRYISLMNEDEKAPIQYLRFEWSLYSTVNWNSQPCNSHPDIKNRLIKKNFDTDSASLVVKCSAAHFNRLGVLASSKFLSTANAIIKDIWTPVAQHKRIKPESTVSLYGYISKYKNDFIGWYVYINPENYGIDAPGDTRYSVPVGERQNFAHNLLDYSVKWNDQFMEEMERVFFPVLFAKKAVGNNVFNFAGRINWVNKNPNSQLASSLGMNYQNDIKTEGNKAHLNSQFDNDDDKRIDEENHISLQKDKEKLLAQLNFERNRRQALEAQISIGQQNVHGEQIKPRIAHALVIGNGAYIGVGRLKNPVNDANAMSQKLHSMGFLVTTVLDLNRENLVKSMAEFRRKSTAADISLLYYAGHGVQIFGTNYILPTDVDQSDPAQATVQGISLNSVIENFLPGKTKIIFLDACRDNPLNQSNNRSVSKGLAAISVAEGTLISYATKDGQTADDGNGDNSPFTQALLEHIADPDDIAVVLRRVREKVMRITAGKQQPWEYGSLTGGKLILSNGNAN
jgi:hypothetical protein